MANPAAVYYSPSAQGDAQLLGSGLGPLTVLRQENARRQAEQARIARLRQQQEQADARNVVPLEANGWLPHNDELNAAVQDGYKKSQVIYADPSLSAFEKKQAVFQIQSGLKQKADLSNEQNKAYQAALAIGKADKRYNTAAFQQAAYKAASAPLGQFDPSSLEAVGTNADYFNRDEVLKQFIKAESDKENQRFGTAAAPGGYGQTNSFNSDVFASKNGKQVFNADGSPAIRDINALLQRAHRDPFMAAILRDNSAKAQQAAGAGAMTSGGEQDYAPLTAEQQMGMAALPRAASAERINLANLVTDYGKVKSSSTQTYRAAPVGRSGGSGTKFTPNPVSSYEGGLTGADLPNVEAPLGTIANAAGVTMPSSQRGFHSFARRPQPTYSTPTNPSKTYEFKALPTTEIIQPGEDGGLRVNKNNKQAIFGIPGEGVNLFRNAKTGEVQIPPDNEAAAARKFRELGSDWSLEAAVQVAVPKNKNFARDSEAIKARLVAREAAKEESTDGYVPKTADQIEKEAFDLASGGTEQQYLPYNKRTRGSIDAQTKNAYAEYADKILPQTQQRLRNSKTTTRPSFLKGKAGAANSKTTNTTDRTGGMM